MGCIKVDHLIEIHDKPHTFLTVIDKTSVHSLILYGVAICVRSFEFTTGDYCLGVENIHVSMFAIRPVYFRDANRL